MTIIATLLTWAIVASYGYLLVVLVGAVVLALLAIGEHTRAGRQARHEDFSVLADSRQTIPVSVVAVATHGGAAVVEAVAAMAAQGYPQYEVIVVLDGSRDETLDALIRVFALERNDAPFRRALPSKQVRGIFESRTHPHLRVIDKTRGGRADAFNCGLNFAQFRYVCVVDAEVRFEPDALLEAMRLAQADPARVVGVVGEVAVADTMARDTGTRASRSLLRVWLRTDRLRAFVNTLAASRLNIVLPSRDTFSLWRRDVVEELGGFAPSFTSAELEFTLRVHEHFRSAKKPYAVQALSRVVAHKGGPLGARALVAQRSSWQRGVCELALHHRRMCLNPTYGAFGLIAMPRFILATALAPAVQALTVLTLPAALWLRLLTPLQCLAWLGVLALTTGVLTNVAMWLQGRDARPIPPPDHWRLMRWAPLELFWYRPIVIAADAAGTAACLVDLGRSPSERIGRPRR
jgi:cellulose synthase/poly-beta-1,6-N-acetylglucosamine synthase-like glycosyltransferase